MKHLYHNKTFWYLIKEELSRILSLLIAIILGDVLQVSLFIQVILF